MPVRPIIEPCENASSRAFSAGTFAGRIVAVCLVLASLAFCAPFDWELSVAPLRDSTLEMERAEGRAQGFDAEKARADPNRIGSPDSVYTFRTYVHTDLADSGEIYMGLGVVNNRIDIHWNGSHVFRWGLSGGGRKTSSYQGAVISLSHERTDSNGQNLFVVQVFPDGFAFQPPEIRIGGYAEIGHFAYLSSVLNLVVPGAGSLASLITCVFVFGLWNGLGRTRPDWTWFSLSALGIAISFIPTIFSSPLHPSHWPRVVGYSGMVMASISTLAFLLYFIGRGQLVHRFRLWLLGICGLFFLASSAMPDLVYVETLFSWAVDLIILPILVWGMGALCWSCWKRRGARDFILAFGFACMFLACMHDLYFFRSGSTPLAWLFPIGFLGVEFAMVALIAMELLAIWKQNQERARELLERGQELARQRSMADEALRARAVFLEKMAHEFRTPMQGLMGMVDLLKGGGEGVDLAMLGGTERLLKRHLVRINSVIDQMDLRQGDLRIRYDRFDPEILAATWKQFFRPVLESSASIGAGGSNFVFGDPERIDRAVVSVGQILSEGLYDMVDVECAHRAGLIEVRLSRRHSRAAHLEERLFGASSSSRQDLDAAAGLAAALGGRLDVRVENSEVACILVFPVKDASGAEGQAPPSHRQSESPYVLLAEDERINARLLLALLERAGCRSIWARDGQEAVDFAMLEPPDLILMDINMPVMDGFEAARILRSDPRTQGIPIVAVSAHAQENATLSEGIDEFIAKPVRAFQIRSLIDKYCRSRAKVVS
jgi:CheY-like chemotaxis protein